MANPTGNPTPDFVQVQLTAAGKAFAGAHPLTISNGRRSFTFQGTGQVKVELSYEWKAFLCKQVVNSNGEAMFEIAPSPAGTTQPPAPQIGVAQPVKPLTAEPEGGKPATPTIVQK